MTGRTHAVLAVALTASVAFPAAAQTPVASFDDLAPTLKPHSTIYVQTADGLRAHRPAVKGTLVDLSASTLRLLVNDQTREFQEHDVRRVSTRHRNAKKGALIGLGAGTGLGLVALMPGCSNDVELGCAFWLGATLGLAGYGTGIGAAVGAVIVRERTLFAAPDATVTLRF